MRLFSAYSFLYLPKRKMNQLAKDKKERKTNCSLTNCDLDIIVNIRKKSISVMHCFNFDVLTKFRKSCSWDIYISVTYIWEY